MNPHLPHWLAAMHLPISPGIILRWLTHFNNIKALFEASQEECQAKGIHAKYIPMLQNPNQAAVERSLSWRQTADHHILSYEDPDYPSLLKEIANPPLVLFVRGDYKLLSQPQIAIVGSRSPSPTGLKNAEQFAAHLAMAGYVITSGLALGIDGASHKGALKAKGKTIGVTGTGLNHIYPATHRALYDEIITQQGAIISEFPLDVGPQAPNFPRRNRIISGLSLGVLVVEAALKSGSLITAHHAIEQGRDVFAIPGSIHQMQAKGCHHLIRQGAKLVEKADDILDELGFIQAFQVASLPSYSTMKCSLDDQASSLLGQIGYEITPMDMIISRSRLTATEVSSILLILELNGYIRAVTGGYVRCV